MKKLLLFLLLPFLSFAQMSGPTSDDVADGEGAAGLTYLGIKSNPNLPIGDVQVNDTIVIGIKLTNWLAGSAENPGNAITYAHIDLQYNKNAYSYLGATYNATAGNPQNNTYEQNGYKWNISSAVEAYDLWGQWQNGGFSSNADWNVLHLQTQVTSGDLADLDEFVTVEFKVNDAGANHDYTDNMFLPNGKLVDNPNTKTYNPVYAYANQDLSLTPQADIDVTVSVKLEVGENVDVTKFNLVPLKKNQTTDNDGDGVPDDFYYTIIQGGTFWIDVPSNGVVDITEYLEDSTGEYAVVWEYGEPGNTNGTNDFKTLYEDILTVSDVQLALKHLATHGAGAINAGVSLLNADVSGGPNGGGDQQLTDADTYSLLAHVMGVDELYVDWDNDGDVDDSDANNQAGYFFRTLDGNVYTTTSAASYMQNGIAHNGSMHPIDIDFTNVTTSQQFAKKGTWKGDVNLSHSPAVDETIANAAMSIANSPSLMRKVQSFGEAKAVAATVNGDMVVTEADGKVVATITIPESDLTATQIKLAYDDTRLTFESVQANSGNTATNFARHTVDRINFGSINMLDNILPQVEYKVIFSPKQALDGVTGLIVLTNTDAADSNADRVELKIQ